MSTTNNMNSKSVNNQLNQQNSVKQSQTDAQADANRAPVQQDYTASAVFNNDKVTSQQVEGLTDTDELSREMDKNPENALNEQGASNQEKTEQNDGSAGNQKIRDAVEHLNEDKLKDNVLEQDRRGTVDIPTPSSPD
ncbi:hypothetical protein BKE30_07365 [Alkanindiges hydrocarboniclasticus]|jgi:hypothetical protein|uniref:Uncharacterized protein n=1 Tax=Alkanindiges hydrocarboniclasticus TaxID=1907941 RepID=A0A1S8CV58_9GAMM|nr:hypothetical protein [Alkanindiges hydrocarboniclasticus]ONG40559.1 hypothetical protein BKE30_07365 [Alkanindiges hydrocarboniclasticus]